MTPIEWRIMPFTFLVVFIPIFFGKPTISQIIDYLENRIKDLKGRLYLVMDPFPTPLDSKKYRKRTIRECSDLLKERESWEFVKFKISLKYILPILIFVLFILVKGVRIIRVNPEPILTYVEKPSEKNSPTLILAECSTLKKLYLIYDNKKKRMLHLGNGDFALIIKLEKSTDIRAGYRIWKSEMEKLTVVPALRVEELVVEYNFPGYLNVTPLHDTILEPEGKILIRVLSGTKVNYSGKTNAALGEVTGTLTQAKVDGKRFHGSFRVAGDKEIEVTLEDTLSFRRSSLYFTLKPIIDEPPTIEFISPGNEYKLNERMEVPITFQASDDYGLSLLKLLYGKEEMEIGKVMGARFIEDSLKLEIRNLFPGETLKVRATAIDLAGNITLTPPINIFMPTLEEMFSNYREFSDTLSTIAEDLQKKEEELIEKIEEYLLKSELNPQIRYGINETLKEQKDLLEDIEKMVELARKMQNPLIMEELSRINELLDELKVKELYRNLENIEKDKDYSERKLRDLNITQEKLLQALKLGRKSLESLKELLELNEFMSRAREIYSEQSEIAGSMPGDSLASIEEDLRDKLSKLTEEMKNSLNKELQEISEEFAKTDTEQKMSELIHEMRKGRMNRTTIEEIMKALESLYESLQNMCECRTGENVRRVLQQKGWELGFILRRHNDLIDKEPDILKGLIEQGLSEGVTQINKELETLFLMSFAFSPRVLSNLSEVSSKMDELGQEIITKKPLLSSMEKVKELLIESIIKLFTSPPRSGQEMMSAMNQIMLEQQSISMGLQQIIPLPANKQTDALRELSRKQRSLANKLREMGEALNPIARDMEEMAERMERGELDERVFERQMKVLDRLLEASKSIRRKEISK